jgi:hypothetical protein
MPAFHGCGTLPTRLLWPHSNRAVAEQNQSSTTKISQRRGSRQAGSPGSNPSPPALSAVSPTRRVRLRLARARSPAAHSRPRPSPARFRRSGCSARSPPSATSRSRCTLRAPFGTKQATPLWPIQSPRRLAKWDPSSAGALADGAPGHALARRPKRGRSGDVTRAEWYWPGACRRRAWTWCGNASTRSMRASLRTPRTRRRGRGRRRRTARGRLPEVGGPVVGRDATRIGSDGCSGHCLPTDA